MFTNVNWGSVIADAVLIVSLANLVFAVSQSRKARRKAIEAALMLYADAKSKRDAHPEVKEWAPVCDNAMDYAQNALKRCGYKGPLP